MVGVGFYGIFYGGIGWYGDYFYEVGLLFIFLVSRKRNCFIVNEWYDVNYCDIFDFNVVGVFDDEFLVSGFVLKSVADIVEVIECWIWLVGIKKDKVGIIVFLYVFL